jgi:predicted nuclease of predicted toxin-antitoxin system
MNNTILKFLADVNIENRIISGLRTDGHDIIWMLEKNKYLTDEEILNMAREEKRIMITNDKDFGEIVYRLKLISNGIVLFRVKDQNENIKLKLIRKAINYKNENLSRYFTVLTEAKIRFIKLEE